VSEFATAELWFCSCVNDPLVPAAARALRVGATMVRDKSTTALHSRRVIRKVVCVFTCGTQAEWLNDDRGSAPQHADVRASSARLSVTLPTGDVIQTTVGLK
jgi:hypothetical protein